VGIAADDRQIMLARDGGDPKVIHRNRGASISELEADLRIMASGCFIGGQDSCGD
jgi:hypothetical protein